MEFALRVLKRVLIGDNSIKLMFIGGGDYKSDEEFLWKEANKLGVAKSVIITGFLPRQDVWLYARDALVCLSPIFPTPILDCGSPTKLLEYMAMGKAVVGNDHPEQKLILSESKAGICVPYEEGAFADAVLYLLSHPTEAKMMGIKGREYVTKHKSYEDVADLVESKIQEVCEKSTD
jgi:glycosyltransferase involved in cell wall biosynthesis